MKKGFTLIELLIVVAIIAILAAIAVPNFLEAQVRAKVSRARSDMRSLATGLESYYVDNNSYPLASRGAAGAITVPAGTINGDAAGQGNANRWIQGSTAELQTVWTFAARQTTGATVGTITTPISYITSYFTDPFKDNKAATFYYYTDGPGWILWSNGPDADQQQRSDLGVAASPNSVETAYTSTQSQPSQTLIAAGGARAFTYDPTNGTVSKGDVYRTKQ